ncbi:hypothetical protein [Halobacterium salinarum]|uniref:hypothetical protein n=1 Tax=Halobacterium salinarum TaxID=2242 RepID=UPI002555675E|nr:hypothetical protein [Halobacterium salinarum]MDL0133514.1 hypothetical protein [Halobacterium salinarum]
MTLSTENSVKAKVHNQPAFDEAEALEALSPGQGVVRGAGGFEAAGADSTTTRVVREQRNPGGRGVEDNESPLKKGYAVGENVETIGFLRFDQARLLLDYADVDGDGTADTYQEGAEVGWNANGHLEVISGGTPTTPVAEIVEDDPIELTAGDAPIHARVEFL